MKKSTINLFIFFEILLFFLFYEFILDFLIYFKIFFLRYFQVRQLLPFFFQVRQLFFRQLGNQAIRQLFSNFQATFRQLFAGRAGIFGILYHIISYHITIDLISPPLPFYPAYYKQHIILYIVSAILGSVISPSSLLRHSRPSVLPPVSYYPWHLLLLHFLNLHLISLLILLISLQQ